MSKIQNNNEVLLDDKELSEVKSMGNREDNNDAVSESASCNEDLGANNIDHNGKSKASTVKEEPENFKKLSDVNLEDKPEVTEKIKDEHIDKLMMGSTSTIVNNKLADSNDANTTGSTDKSQEKLRLPHLKDVNTKRDGLEQVDSGIDNIITAENVDFNIDRCNHAVNLRPYVVLDKKDYLDAKEGLRKCEPSKFLDWLDVIVAGTHVHDGLKGELVITDEDIIDIVEKNFLKRKDIGSDMLDSVTSCLINELGKDYGNEYFSPSNCGRDVLLFDEGSDDIPYYRITDNLPEFNDVKPKVVFSTQGLERTITKEGCLGHDLLFRKGHCWVYNGINNHITESVVMDDSVLIAHDFGVEHIQELIHRYDNGIDMINYMVNGKLMFTKKSFRMLLDMFDDISSYRKFIGTLRDSCNNLIDIKDINGNVVSMSAKNEVSWGECMDAIHYHDRVHTKGIYCVTSNWVRGLDFLVKWAYRLIDRPDLIMHENKVMRVVRESIKNRFCERGWDVVAFYAQKWYWRSLVITKSGGLMVAPEKSVGLTKSFCKQVIDQCVRMDYGLVIELDEIIERVNMIRDLCQIVMIDQGNMESTYNPESVLAREIKAWSAILVKPKIKYNPSQVRPLTARIINAIGNGVESKEPFGQEPRCIRRLYRALLRFDGDSSITEAVNIISERFNIKSIDDCINLRLYAGYGNESIVREWCNRKSKSMQRESADRTTISHDNSPTMV